MRTIAFLAAFLLSVVSTYGIQGIGNWIQKPAHARAEVIMQALPTDECVEDSGSAEVQVYKYACSRAQNCVAHACTAYAPSSHKGHIGIITSFDSATNTLEVEVSNHAPCMKSWENLCDEIGSSLHQYQEPGVILFGAEEKDSITFWLTIQDPAIQHVVQQKIEADIERLFQNQF